MDDVKVIRVMRHWSPVRLKFLLYFLLITNLTTAILLGRALYNNWWDNQL